MSERDPIGSESRTYPVLSEERAATICRRHFLRPRTVSRLAGYENANFHVEDESGRAFVLKASPEEDDRRRLELEVDLLAHLEVTGWPGTPRGVESRRGRSIERVRVDGRTLDVRLLTWVEGGPLTALTARPPGLVREIGAYLAGLDLALAEYAAGQERRSRTIPPALWNLAAPETWPDTTAVEPTEDRRRVEAALEALGDHLASARPAPRRALIHADPNDHNLLVVERDGRPRLAGLIDFGDSGESVLVFEIAIAAAYLGLGEPDPWDPVPALVAGYTSRLRLQESELDLLLPAVRARLALSLAMSAAKRRQGRVDPYVVVSERPARRALARLMELSSRRALERLHDAATGRADG
ncbi:MAG: phosphotransferase [Thermoanaerobaculia bacterium]|nr:phosphotransferase [Thermoanaerobaculia bacterium]